MSAGRWVEIMKGPQRLKPRIWGIFTARLEAVPFHGGLDTIYETASRRFFPVPPGPTFRGLRRLRMCFARTRAGLYLARRPDGHRRTSIRTHASADDKTRWRDGPDFPQSLAAPAPRRHKTPHP